MKAAKKTLTVQPVSGKKTAKQPINPFAKLIADKKRIVKAVREKTSLSVLTGIKFVRPL